jgi:hypothetical protein
MLRSGKLIDLVRRLAPFTTAALLVALAYLAWELYARRAADIRFQERLRDKAPARSAVTDDLTGVGLKVLHFYASPAVLGEGDRAVLCYGVRGAASVKIEPGVEAVSPSLNRCVGIDPEETTNYTLTAADGQGNTASASFVMQVTPDPDKQPKVVYFTPGRKLKEGERTLYTLCFETRNAAEVRIEPRVFPPGPLLRGCFHVAPENTTTYKLTVTDAKGRQAERAVTLTP